MQKIIILLAVMIFILTGCGGCEKKDKDLMKVFMKERYGEYDEKEKGYYKKNLTESDEGQEFVYQICDQKEIRIKDETHILLAVCGKDSGACHGCEGTIDLYVLKKKEGKYQLLVRSDKIKSGSYGEPGKISIVNLGRTFYGFRLDDGYDTQGYYYSSTRIFAPNGHHRGRP